MTTGSGSSADASPPWLAQTRAGAQSPFGKAPPGSPFAGATPLATPQAPRPGGSTGAIPEHLKPAPPPPPPAPVPPPAITPPPFAVGPPPAQAPAPPPFTVGQQSSPAAPPLTVGQQAAPPPSNLASSGGLVTPSGLAPAAGPGGAPMNLGPIAAAPGAPSAPAMVSTAVAATVGVVAVSNAAAANARAAAQAQSNAAGGAQPAQAAAPRATGTRPREVIDLLWFDPKALPRVRAAWKKLLESAKPDPAGKKDGRKKDDLGFDDDEDDAQPPPPPDPPEMADRRDVSTVMARGELLEPDWVNDAIAGAVEGDGSFLPPLILTGGELLFPFDELEALKATMTVVSPLVGGDKKLKETVDSVNDLLQNKALESSAGVAEGLTARVKEAFGAQGRMLPANYLDATTERMLLEQRRYQKRTVFGAPWVRAELSTSGTNAVPVYLPDALASQLPMFQRFRAKVIAEAHLSQDQYETSPTALKVIAVARVMPVGLGGAAGARGGGEKRA